MGRRSLLSRIVRGVHHGIFHESREGRAAEVVGWANAAAAASAGVGVCALLRAWTPAIIVAAAAFVALRLALANRYAIWGAGLLGTTVIAGLGGGLAWVFAHVTDWPPAPVIAAALGGLASGALPAWAYVRLARQRGDDVPDSLLEPVSVPLSSRR